MNNGFTLIETIIYVALMGMVASAFVYLGVSISESRNKTYAAQVVQSDARSALEILSGRIRTAGGVNAGASTFGSDPGVLSLVMSDAGLNPTVFDLDQDDGTLRITEGVSSPIDIISSRVQVTNLVFSNLTDGERENVRIEMTLEYLGAGDREFTYSQSFTTAVSVRR